MNQPDVYARSTQSTQEWIREICDLADNENDQVAYQALRATLHALRDRIPVDATAHFAAQLPTMLRGIYYEGWDPSKTPKEIRNRDEFLGVIRDEYNYPVEVDLEYLSSAVFETINHQVSTDLARKTRHLLNEELRTLWPDPGTAWQQTEGERKER